jgi:hypothetical protein
METSEHTCIICYTVDVETRVDCCKKPICASCWKRATSNSRCPHCRASVRGETLLKGNGISNHTITIGNPFEETIINMIIWNFNSINPATLYASRHIDLNGNRGNVVIHIIEDPDKHQVIPNESRTIENIIYYR